MTPAHVFVNGAGTEFWVATSLDHAKQLTATAELPDQQFQQLPDNHVLLVRTVNGPPEGRTCAMWAEASPAGRLFTIEQLFA